MRAPRFGRRKGPFSRSSGRQSSRVQHFTRLRYEPLEQRALLSAAPLAVDLQAVSDSGLYDDDNLTNIETPAIDITAAQSGDTIRIYREGILLGEATQVNGTQYQYEFLSEQLTEGTNAITARSFDGVDESVDSPALTITLDTTGPKVVAHSPDGATLPTDSLSVTFDEPIDPATLTADNASIHRTSSGIVGSFNSGGVTKTITISGSLAYVAVSSGGLRIIDVSNPASPVLIGNYATRNIIGNADVSGTLAYVSDSRNGLAIFDVSMPSLPTLVCNYETSGHPCDVTISGSLAYVAEGDSGFEIIDVSNPSSPVLVGSYDTSDSAWDITVSGTFAYVACDEDGLQVFDVSDPSSPELVANYDTSGIAGGVTILGSLAYVADGDSGLEIIDISTPSSPVLVGSFDTSGPAYDLTVFGTLAYVATCGNGLQIIDVSDPSSPALVSSYDTTGYTLGVTVSGTLAYVADGSDGLKILEIFIPEIAGVTPVSRTTWQIDLAAELPEGEYDVSVDPYVTDLAGNTMDQNINGIGGQVPEDVFAFNFTVDTTPPTIPGELAFMDDTGSRDNAVTSDALLTFTWSESTDTSGIDGYEYRLDGGGWIYTTELVAADIAVTEGDRLFEVRAIDAVGNISEVASLTVAVDLTNPDAPTGLQLDGSVFVWEEAADANGIWKYEYCIDGGSWIEAVDREGQTGFAEGQSGLLEVRAIDRAGNTGDIAAATLTVDLGPSVVSHGPGGLVGPIDSMTVTFNKPIDPTTLTVEDVSIVDPSFPTFLGAYDNGNEIVIGVTVSGNLAYVISYESDMIIVDVSDPSSPVLVGSYDACVSGVAISGTLAYVTDTENGLVILDVSDPSSPTFGGGSNICTHPQSITVSGTLAYVADGENGLMIFDVSDPSSPVLASCCHTGDRADDVTVSGTLAYVANYTSGLAIIDVTNPASPTLIGNYDTSGVARSVAACGTLAYVMDSIDGLVIIDASDPSSPVLVGSCDTSGLAMGVTVSGTTVYVADLYSILIIDVSDPSSPTLIKEYCKNGDYPVSVYISDGLAYVAKQDRGLGILDLFMPEVAGITQVDQTTWQIDFATELPEGEYHVSIGPNVKDLSGNTLDQDADGIGGETPDDAYMFSFTVQTPMPGDADLSGSVDEADAAIVAENWGEQYQKSPGDADRSGLVDETDLAIVNSHLGMAGMSWADGDFNGDGQVDLTDASVLAANWGAISKPVTWRQGDFNDDGIVNAIDASIMAANWGATKEADEPIDEPLVPSKPLIGPLPASRPSTARRLIIPTPQVQSVGSVRNVGSALLDTLAGGSSSASTQAEAACDAVLLDRYEQYEPRQLQQVESSALAHERLAWSYTLAQKNQYSQEKDRPNAPTMAIDMLLATGEL